MKIVKTEEVALDSAKLTVTIDLDTKQPMVQLSYTCPKCNGWGCNHHSQNNANCNGGNVYVKVESGKLESILGPEVAASVRNILKSI